MLKCRYRYPLDETLWIHIDARLFAIAKSANEKKSTTGREAGFVIYVGCKGPTSFK